MAEQEKQGEKPEVTATEIEATKEQPATKPVTVEELQAKLEQLERTAQNKAEEAARVHKKLQAFEKAEEERKRAEMSETERIKADLEKAQVELKRAQLDNLKNAVAAEVGLPPILAQRLRGDDKESLVEDAKALLESLPKPKTAASISATNPGTGAQASETPEQKRARLFGTQADPFSDDVLRNQGGGVYFIDKE